MSVNHNFVANVHDATDERSVKVTAIQTGTLNLEYSPFAKTQCNKTYGRHEADQIVPDMFKWTQLGELPCS